LPAIAPKLLPVVTIATAVASALLFSAAGIPLAWILGALVGSAIVTNLAAPMRGGRYLRRLGQLFIGVSVGGVLTPDVVAELGRLLPLMLGIAVASNLMGLVLAAPIAWVAGVDRLTGLLSCLPAGMAEMATLARDLGGHDQTVAVIHTLRVLMVLSFITLWLGATAGTPAPRPATELVDAAVILGIVIAGGLIAAAATRFGVLNPWVIAPMLLCLAIVALGATLPPVPGPVLVVAQMAIGASLGLRFRVESFRMLPRAALAGLVSGAALIAIAVLGFASAVEVLAGLSPATATLSVMPGGLGEMIAASAALGLFPATVAGFQITRSIVTNIFAPLLIRWAVARSGGRKLD
jgi:membrane AbrB-like protein